MPWWAIGAIAAALPMGWLSAVAVGRLAGVAGPSARRIAGCVAADLAVAIMVAALTAPGWTYAASLGLGWTLVLLAAVDAIALRLPDVITAPLGLAGLVAAPRLLGAPRLDHLIGAAAGFAALAGVAWIYRRLRGRAGLGLGDAKLAACAGAWLGWAALPSLVLIASGTGLAWVAIVALRRRTLDLAAPLPFGPALCLAFWTLWLLATHRSLTL